MRRITRILGVIGGVGALLWAMRRRVMSVAIPREPKLPTFTVPERLDPPGVEASSEDEPSDSPTTLTDVSGIGPVYATRLAAAGVNTVADLAAADPEKIADAVEAPVGRVQRWVESARQMTDV